MQAVHHWHSESLGRETGVPIPHIWQVQTSNEAAVWAALARRLSAVADGECRTVIGSLFPQSSGRRRHKKRKAPPTLLNPQVGT